MSFHAAAAPTFYPLSYVSQRVDFALPFPAVLWHSATRSEFRFLLTNTLLFHQQHGYLAVKAIRAIRLRKSCGLRYRLGELTECARSRERARTVAADPADRLGTEHLLAHLPSALATCPIRTANGISSAAYASLAFGSALSPKTSKISVA